MEPRGDGNYRTGEKHPPGSDGDKKPHEGEAVFAGGEVKKYRVDVPAPRFLNTKNKKTADIEAALGSLFSGDECKKRPAGGDPFFSGDKCKKRPAGGDPFFSGDKCKKRPAGGHPFSDGDGEAIFAGGEDKMRWSMLPGGEVKKYCVDEPPHLFLNGKRKKPHDIESAPLLPSDEAKNKKLHGGDEAESLPGGEAEKHRADEAVRRFTDGDKNPKAMEVAERTPALIAEAIEANGSPPRRLLHLRSESDDEDKKEDPVALALYWRGVEREDHFDPYPDYFFLGRPKEESWHRIWRERPPSTFTTPVWWRRSTLLSSGGPA